MEKDGKDGDRDGAPCSPSHGNAPKEGETWVLSASQRFYWETMFGVGLPLQSHMG